MNYLVKKKYILNKFSTSDETVLETNSYTQAIMKLRQLNLNGSRCGYIKFNSPESMKAYDDRKEFRRHVKHH